MKVGKQELEVEREKLLMAIQTNEKLKLELREKQEQIENELKERIERIMETERHKHQVELKDIERELYEVNRTLASVQHANEKLGKDHALQAAENQENRR